MGMMANYQYINDSQYEELKNYNEGNDEMLDKVEEWNEEEEILLDIDKMWDVLHFVLTGIDSTNPIEGDPLSEAIVGEVSLDTSEFVAYISKERVPAILEALEKFDFEKAMDNFSMQKCKEAELYPDIWGYEDEIDDIKEEISDYFKFMKSFYKKILEKNGNVLVTIY